MENLPTLKKENFIEKIKNRIKLFFGIYKEKEAQVVISEIRENKPNFKDEIKFEEDLGKKKLLEIQKKLEEGGMNLELASDLTKDLTSQEKYRLLELYKTQINELEESLKNYKRKIIAIRNKINV